MKIGVLCPAEIAYRRFMPALSKINNLRFAGVGVYSKEERFGRTQFDDLIASNAVAKANQKADMFIQNYGGKIYKSYAELVSSKDVDSVYIPLPPALHYEWAKKALLAGKHVLLEKPFTTTRTETEDVIQIAKSKKLAIHENYMFVFHNQLKAIDDIVKSGKIGDIRIYRINFGFPKRAENDFRYNKKMGGGALLDAGGYTIKYASHLLGENAHVAYAKLNYSDSIDVDLYGSGALINQEGTTVQVSFGMDNNYKCELEAWGSLGYLRANRVLTAPADFTPQAVLQNANRQNNIELPSDDAFKKSIEYFVECINDCKVREKNYENIRQQSILMEEFRKKGDS